MKFVGKPYSGEPHVRFDEGERASVPFSTLRDRFVGLGFGELVYLH